MRRHCPGHHQRRQDHQALRSGGGSFGRNKRRASETVTKRKRSRSDYGGRPGGCGTESGGCSEGQMKLRATISIAVLLTSLVWAQKSPRLESATTVIESTLPRKAKGHPEAYPNAIVMYDSVTAPDGKHLRTIITKPRGAKKKLPVIFVAGWLSCDSVEAPADTKDESGLVFRGLAQLQEFALFRMDKQGVGDSEGDCGETDFESELTAYRAAFRAVKNYDFIDANRIYILGISNGGGFAPLVPESDAEQAQVRGYISIGGWVKTWFEHMLEIERRRFALMGKSP